MIKVAHLSKSFDSQVILDDVNFEIPQGEVWAILGESGAGKSVLLKHLMGLLKSDQGSVVVGDVDIMNLSEKELLPIRKRIGYLFQEGALYDFMTVFENIAFPLREHTSLSEEIISQKVHEILKTIDLEDVNDKFPSQLSGGMKKRVALARAIILDSKILLCDEPTSGLDPIRSRDISDLIKSISKKFGCTTVITSHDIPNAFRIADRLLLIKDGKIIAMGTREELMSSSNSFVQEFINIEVKK